MVQVRYLIKLSNLIDYYVGTCVASLDYAVYERFQYFKPLANEKHFVADYPYIYSKDNKLYVGEWIYTDTYGLNVIYPYFIKCIKRYGYQIAEHVREEIRKDFTKSVELTNRLILYNELELGSDVDAVLRSRTGGIHIHRIMLKGNDLLAVTDDNRSLSITRKYELVNPVMHELVNLYEDMVRLMKKAETNNKSILEEMDLVIMPYRLSKGLSS